jgi:hypothetical protein
MHADHFHGFISINRGNMGRIVTLVALMVLPGAIRAQEALPFPEPRVVKRPSRAATLATDRGFGG